MPPTETSVTTRWDVQPTPTADSERLLRLLFHDDNELTAVSR